MRIWNRPQSATYANLPADDRISWNGSCRDLNGVPDLEAARSPGLICNFFSAGPAVT